MVLRLFMSLLLSAIACIAAAQSKDRKVDPAEFNGFDVRGALVPIDAIEHGGPPRDAIPAINHPQFVPADRSTLRPDDRVLGLAYKGTARAYPVRILNWHEAVNDRIAADALVITYCPLCGTGMAFRAEVPTRQGAARELTFGISGLLLNSDVLLYDRATESLWSQLREQAISGPLKGTRLATVPLEHTTWQDWRRRFPATEAMSFDTGYSRDYQRDPYADYAVVSRLMFPVQHTDERIGAKEWVLGLSIANASKAYPFAALAARVDRDGVLEDQVGGQRVRIRYDAQHRTARAEDSKGAALPTVTAYWFAWFAFHPDTAVLR
jgi:hypothetical protein